MGILVIGAVLTLIGNLLADVSYGLTDPRIRKG
jgi:peptide/nickel transport system permease protein